MLNGILSDFPKQFSWEPKIENGKNLRGMDFFVVAGMGGSHLAADIVDSLLPESKIKIHSDYGLPEITDQARTLFIASSYSGNTEEVIDSIKAALENKIPSSAIATGGKLLDIAKKNGIPFIQTPDIKIEPRFALGYSLVAILKLMGENSLLNQASVLTEKLDVKSADEKGKELASKLKNKIPVIYSSAKNRSAAHIWKIKFNETSKIPAFCNEFPELNHNEMTGFDTKERTIPLMDKFHFIFLRDSEDHPRVQKRMEVTKNLLERQGFRVEILPIEGESGLHKIFSSVFIADWTSLYLAEFYRNEPIAVPIVEDFKKLIA